MDESIFDYISPHKHTNGSVKIYRKLSQERKITLKLRDLGYFWRIEDGKQQFFKSEKGKLWQRVKIQDVKNAFLDFLINTKFNDRPDYLSDDDIKYWFFKRNIVRANGIFFHFLKS